MLIRALLRHPGIRRPVTVTALGMICVLAAALLPVAVLFGGIGALRPGGRGRLARFSAFLAVYLVAEVTGLVKAVALWVGSFLRRGARDGERYEDAHYVLLDELLTRLWATARRYFGLQIRPPDRQAPLPAGPLLVFSRHAGPGDSFLLVYALLEAVRRRPRIVLKHTLALDPLIDVVLSRTPNCFVGASDEERAQVPERIAELAESLRTGDALLLFPEGGNFTRARRSRLLERMRSRGRWSLLPAARSLEHVLPARTAGVFAAIDAAPPGTTAVFVAHTGLDRLESVRDVWQAVPLDAPLELAWWTTPIEQIPADPADRERWLAAHWTRIDDWIDRRSSQRAEPADVADLAANLEPRVGDGPRESGHPR
jgi:1-acyl-sn-glycerol-3-phosphate acyltransferase